MTFAQLQAFALVARLGSVKAAAAKLGVSEPAVSEAVAALRRDFGDDLLVRSGRGLTLTAGGRRLAGAAAEILGLADQARRDVREAHGERALLRVAADAAVAEHAAGPLLDAFRRRAGGSTEVVLQVEPPEAFADLLEDRLADVTLGARAGGAGGLGIEAVPFLRRRLVVVAPPGHPLAGRRGLPPSALAGARWLTGPAGADPSTGLGGFLARHGLEAEDAQAFPNEAAALAAVASGMGIMLALGHAVHDDLRRGLLVRLDVRGTPHDHLWHACALRPDRRPPGAWALLRFVTTPEATQAILTGRGGVPAGRFRPPVHVTLWSGG